MPFAPGGKPVEQVALGKVEQAMLFAPGVKQVGGFFWQV